MRFHCGSIPDFNFSPDDSWHPLREPGAWIMQLCALPIGIVTAAAVGWCWLQLRFAATSSHLQLGGVEILLSFPLLIVAHELIHAATYPDNGPTRATIIGFWPSRLLFYAAYDGPLTRNRFLAVFIMPFFILTLLPLAICAALDLPFSGSIIIVAWCSCLNALFSCGDLFGLALVRTQVPPQAECRNEGYRTFWRVPTDLNA